MDRNYLKNEINELEKLASHIKDMNFQISEEQYNSDISIIKTECSRIKDDIWKSIFTMGLDQFRISSFIDYQLNKIIDFSDELYLIQQDFIEKVGDAKNIQLGLDLYRLTTRRDQRSD